MTDELREQIAKIFKIARQEGKLRHWADGLADADDCLDLIEKAGYRRVVGMENKEKKEKGNGDTNNSSNNQRTE